MSDPRSRSREAISRLLEAAHYTEREERGSYSPDTGGEGELADGEDDIEEVEVSGGEDPTNNSWCNNSIFRSTRVRYMYLMFVETGLRFFAQTDLVLS